MADDTPMVQDDDVQADGYYDDDMGSDELDLSFLDDDDTKKEDK